jgi:peptidoglycan/LPS O-acetylase OafA/YrhL
MRADNQDRAVNGLRGLTLLVIVSTHFIPADFYSFNIPKPASCVLFAVAGYFLMLLLMKNAPALDGPRMSRVRTILRLLFLRHLRIWPVMAIAIGLYFLLAFAFPDLVTTQIFRTWPLYLAYLGNIPKIIYGASAFPQQFWVVSAQEQMILLYSLLVIAVGLTKANRTLPYLVGFGIAGRLAMTFFFMPDQPALALETPLSAVDALALGMLARLAVEQKISRSLLRRTNITAAVVLALLWVILPNWWTTYFTLVPLIVSFLSCALIVTMTDPLRDHRLQKTIFSYPLFVVLGQMSLTLFFLHPLVSTLFRLVWAQYVRTPLEWWKIAIAGPVLSLIVAFAFFRVIEVPLRRLRGQVGISPDKVKRADILRAASPA